MTRLTFADLLHQVQLRRQAPGGVGEHDVDAARLRRVDRVEDHRRGVARFLRDHCDVVALAPDLQLLARGGAKRVARGQQHRFALLPDNTCASLPIEVVLPAPLTPASMMTKGLTAVNFERHSDRLEERKQRLAQAPAATAVARADHRAVRGRAVPNQEFRGGHADVACSSVVSSSEKKTRRSCPLPNSSVRSVFRRSRVRARPFLRRAAQPSPVFGAGFRKLNIDSAVRGVQLEAGFARRSRKRGGAN